MTQLGRIRIAVYFGALIYLFAPAWILITARSPTINSGGFYLSAVVLLFFIVVARWDIVGYWLQLFFLLILLIIAYQRGGWLPPVSTMVVLLLFEFFLRRSGKQPLELSFPLAGGTYYVAHGGTFRLCNYHRVSKSQAYALDIVRLNRLGMRAAGIYPDRLEKYRIFGDSLYSPCTGVVTVAVDGFPDLPLGEMDKKHPAGNHVVIQLDGLEVYVGLAHLMRGSVAVKAGERVSAGQPLGRVGNSGNTSEPHLHIHAKRGGSPESILDGEGIPMRFGKRWLIRNSVVRSHRAAA